MICTFKDSDPFLQNLYWTPSISASTTYGHFGSTGLYYSTVRWNYVETTKTLDWYSGYVGNNQISYALQYNTSNQQYFWFIIK